MTRPVAMEITYNVIYEKSQDALLLELIDFDVGSPIAIKGNIMREEGIFC